MKKWLIGIIVMLVILTGTVLLIQNRQQAREELTIFAASSLTDVLRELTGRFQTTHPEVEFVLNFGSSGTLQIQIEQGAPLDIFMSAGQKQMNALTEKKLIEAESVQNFASNRLVAIASSGSELTVTEESSLMQARIRQISIGDPTSVPVGQYTEEALRQLQVWDSLKDKLVYASNVRQVLQYVEQEEVELGFVYSTDALVSEKVKVLWTVPSTAHRAIVYPMGISRESKQKPLAEEFLSWVASSAGQESLTRYGFASGE